MKYTEGLQFAQIKSTEAEEALSKAKQEHVEKLKAQRDKQLKEMESVLDTLTKSLEEELTFEGGTEDTGEINRKLRELRKLRISDQERTKQADLNTLDVIEFNINKMEEFSTKEVEKARIIESKVQELIKIVEDNKIKCLKLIEHQSKVSDDYDDFEKLIEERFKLQIDKINLELSVIRSSIFLENNRYITELCKEYEKKIVEISDLKDKKENITRQLSDLKSKNQVDSATLETHKRQVDENKKQIGVNDAALQSIMDKLSEEDPAKKIMKKLLTEIDDFLILY